MNIKLLFIMIIAFLSLITGCEQQYWDGTKDGKQYRINKSCVRSHSEMRYEYGFSIRGRYESYWTWVNVCDEYHMDTVWNKELMK